MNIKTKYDIGDEVYFFGIGLEKGTIKYITSFNSEELSEFTYHISHGEATNAAIKEKDIFKSTKELYKHL